MMVGLSSVRSHVSGRCFKTDGGNCKSRNVVYAAQCTDCSLQYVGQTTQTLRDRINGHRASCSGSSRMGESVDPLGNLRILRAMTKHCLITWFRYMVKMTLMPCIDSLCERDVSPRSLGFAEHAWIAKLQTITPEGINIANPCGVRQDLVTRVLHDL